MSGPLVVLLGETASGKSALAIELAEKFNGEIICADSRTVYRGMDIGTAKPTPEDRGRVPHHCLDLVTPDEPFTVADFKQQALTAVADITARGKLPIMVGGTGLYLDAVLYDFEFRSPADPEMRKELAALDVSQLQQQLAEQGIPLPNNPQNPRHLVRSLETGGVMAAHKPLRVDTLILGLQIDREILNERIEKRVRQMVDQGFVEEVRQLGQRYGWDVAALQAPGYKAFRAYLAGEASLDEAIDQFVRNDRQLAKRQRTWFRRNNSVHWLNNRDNFAESVELITTFLNK